MRFFAVPAAGRAEIPARCGFRRRRANQARRTIKWRWGTV